MIHNINLKFDGSIDDFYNVNRLTSILESLKMDLRDFKIQTLNDFENTSLRFTNIVDGFEYLQKFNEKGLAQLNKIKSQYEKIPKIGRAHV